MKLIKGFKCLPEFSQGTVVSIGNFDGVHRGHQALLNELHTQACRLTLPSLLVLFEPQPSEYFHGVQAPPRLYSLREKLSALRQSGIDFVYCLKFDKHLALMQASEFAEYVLFTLLQAKYLLVGHDFRFGHGRQGNIILLRELAAKHACYLSIFSEFDLYGQRISSTKIRQCLQQGDLNTAANYLGRQYSVCGNVVRGAGRGRQWGIPTANLNLRRLSIPLHGVFYVQVTRENGTIVFGVANIGRRPTIGGHKDILEVHLLDFDEQLYGERLEVCFLRKLRDEIAFPTVTDLIAQIRQDIIIARSCGEI